MAKQPQKPNEILQAAVEYLMTGGIIEGMVRNLAEKGLIMNKTAVSRAKAAPAKAGGKRGPVPGTGGRPPKAGARRITRGVNLTPDTWARVEAARLPGESLGDVVERLLREKIAP